ncbi:MAG: DNA polymerase III subunit gamma/tau [Oscillospiraceae bacterium]|nr:DNA polymerase III subunit gamma/tau [Oscillospiraceae bacterium]
MYQALYRKYRPVTFTDVISQDHITTTLKNQIISGKTAHAYLFTGSRGTGKTTCARIFAKALNCLSPVNGDPCNECEICKAADEFALTDIVEIDAASNGSVDDARELREAALYTPERCRYKVYIIDEVHMLSKDAFNALLKIIEEPPPHVKFIMATTELHKVLPTILSRCQRFDFMRIRTEDIASRVTHIAALENITIDADSAELIAKTADGGMRDALSILDRCISYGEKITLDVVSEATGIAGRSYLFDIIGGIADNSPASCLDVISTLYDRSKDMQRLCEELILQFRNILIAVSAPENKKIIICLPSELTIIEELAKKLTAQRILSIIDALGRCIERMRQSVSKRIDLEICIIKLCSGGVSDTADSGAITELDRRINAIEDRIRNGLPSAPPQMSPARREMQLSQPVNGINLISCWGEVTGEIARQKPDLSPLFVGSTGYTNGQQILINSKNPLLKGLLGKNEHKQFVLDTVIALTKLDLNKILVGYRAELDRSGTADIPQVQADTEKKASVSDILKRAEENGIPVEDI